jgi:hypothetical protein
VTANERIHRFLRGWLPQEPLLKTPRTQSVSQPQTKTQLDKKAFKVASIANAVLVNIFLGVNFLVLRPIYHYYMSLELSVLALSILAAGLVAVNLVIYRHYKTRFMPKWGNLK